MEDRIEQVATISALQLNVLINSTRVLELVYGEHEMVYEGLNLTLVPRVNDDTDTVNIIVQLFEKLPDDELAEIPLVEDADRVETEMDMATFSFFIDALVKDNFHQSTSHGYTEDWIKSFWEDLNRSSEESNPDSPFVILDFHVTRDSMKLSYGQHILNPVDGMTHCLYEQSLWEHLVIMTPELPEEIVDGTK